MKTNTTEEGIEKAFTNGTSYLWAPRRREKPCMMECHDKSGVPVTVFTVGTQTSEVTVRGVRMWEKQGENASGRVSGVRVGVRVCPAGRTTVILWCVPVIRIHVAVRLL